MGSHSSTGEPAGFRFYQWLLAAGRASLAVAFLLCFAFVGVVLAIRLTESVGCSTTVFSVQPSSSSSTGR